MGEMNARRAMVEFVMQERCDGVVFDSEKSGLDGEAVSGFEKVVSGSLFREVCSAFRSVTVVVDCRRGLPKVGARAWAIKEKPNSEELGFESESQRVLLQLISHHHHST